jgi:hypothetical protein
MKSMTNAMPLAVMNFAPRRQKSGRVQKYNWDDVCANATAIAQNV